MRILVTLLCSTIFPALVFAADITDTVQKRYETLHSFRAFFTQHLTNAATQKTEERLGSIVFSKPKLLRWETTSPEEELLIVGPQAAWEYLPEDGIAYRYTTEQIFQSKTMLRFISGEANLKEDFAIVDKGMDAGLYLLELTPKEPEPGLTFARVWIRPEDGLLERIRIVDFFGNENAIELKAIELDPAVDSKIFTFTPPQGTQVIPGKVQ